MSCPRLLIVADHGYIGDTARCLALLAETAGVARGLPVALQLRAKALDAERLERLAARAREQVPPGVTLMLNGPPALAERLGFDGAHWPQAAIPDHPSESHSLPCSAAIHDEAALRRAEKAGAAFVIFGSVYPPGSKSGAARGVEALRRITRLASVPVLAIGGITPKRAGACRRAGAAGVASVSGVLGTRDPGAAIHAYLHALEGRTATAAPDNGH